MKLFCKKYKRFLIPLLLLLALYLLLCCCLSLKVYRMVKCAYEDAGANNPYGAIMSDEVYQRLSVSYSVRAAFPADAPLEGKTVFTVPFFLILPNGTAKSRHYYFSDYKNPTDGSGTASLGIPVSLTWQLQGGKWVLTHFFEPA